MCCRSEWPRDRESMPAWTGAPPHCEPDRPPLASDPRPRADAVSPWVVAQWGRTGRGICGSERPNPAPGTVAVDGPSVKDPVHAPSRSRSPKETPQQTGRHARLRSERSLLRCTRGRASLPKVPSFRADALTYSPPQSAPTTTARRLSSPSASVRCTSHLDAPDAPSRGTPLHQSRALQLPRSFLSRNPDPSSERAPICSPDRRAAFGRHPSSLGHDQYAATRHRERSARGEASASTTRQIAARDSRPPA